jgi:hypothetical protein
MEHVHSLVLPGLTLDAIRCLSLAQDHISDDLRGKTRLTILSLRAAHTTDTAAAVSVLRQSATHMMDVEQSLSQASRPITAQKVRSVRQRVQYVVLM